MCLTFSLLPPNFPKPPVGKERKKRKSLCTFSPAGWAGKINKRNPDRYVVPVI